MKIYQLIVLPILLVSIVSCGGGGGESPAPEPSNVAPTANAGVDMTVDENTTVTLSGTGTDSDGSVISYSWKQVSGTTATIVNSSNATASFIAPDIDSNEVLIFELSITDNKGATATDKVEILVINFSADFPITEDNRKLVRYQPNNYIKYDIVYTTRETENTDSLIERFKATTGFSLSQNPLSFLDDSVESIEQMYKMVSIDSNIAVILNFDVIQLPSEQGYTSDLIAYYVRGVDVDNGNEYKSALGIIGDVNYGKLSLMGSPYVGYHYNTEVTEIKVNTDSVNSVPEFFQIVTEMTISKKEIVETPLGTFETFKIETTYIKTDSNGDNETIIGNSWFHPSIGILKADNIFTSSKTNIIFDITQMITSTNLHY